MGHCHFMAWHTLQDALKMTGRSRSQFYRDMRAGLVSYRTRGSVGISAITHAKEK